MRVLRISRDPNMPDSPQATFGPVTVHFGEKNGKYPDGNQVVVRGKEGLVIFDTPLSARALAGRFQAADAVVLGHVHEDHVCALSRLPGVVVYAPEADLAALQSVDGLMAHYGYAPEVEPKMLRHVVEDYDFAVRPDAVGYPDGQTWDLGDVTVRAVHMPGHTAGHSVLMVEPHGIAFLGDIDLTGFGPYYGDATSDLRQFRSTLERVPDLDASVWITFHHKGVITARAEMLELLSRFAQRVEERHEAIHEAVLEGTCTLSGLVARRFVYPSNYDGIFVEDAERKTIGDHLSLLVEEGRLHRDGDQYGPA